MKPKFLGGDAPDVAGKDRRVVLAEVAGVAGQPLLRHATWPTASGPTSSGAGIIEPVDDVRVSNPAVNPELLDELGKRFTEYKYDFKKLVRDICNSRTYQRSTAAQRRATQRDDAELRPRHRPPDQGRDAARLHQRR